MADDSPFAIDSATGEISIKDASVFDFEGDSIPTSVEVTVTDADGLSTSQTLDINVTNVNEGPSLSFDEGTSVNVAENTAAGTVIANRSRDRSRRGRHTDLFRGRRQARSPLIRLTR